MKNITNGKPTYAELESKVAKQADEYKSLFVGFLALFVILFWASSVCGIGWYMSKVDAKFYRDSKNEYFDKWRACSIAPPIDYIEQARFKVRESELAIAQFDFQVKRAQWEAQIQVEEAKLDLQKERLNLETQQQKFNSQARAINKVIQSAK